MRAERVTNHRRRRGDGGTCGSLFRWTRVCPSRSADVPYGVERERRLPGTTRAEHPSDPTTCAAVRLSISSVPQPKTTSDAVIEAAALGMLRSGASWLPKTRGRRLSLAGAPIRLPRSPVGTRGQRGGAGKDSHGPAVVGGESSGEDDRMARLGRIVDGHEDRVGHLGSQGAPASDEDRDRRV